MRADTPLVGPSSLALLSAIQEGLVHREPEPYRLPRGYLYDGEPMSPMWISWLAKEDLIDMTIHYPPAINAYGVRVLREYIEDGWEG